MAVRVTVRSRWIEQGNLNGTKDITHASNTRHPSTPISKPIIDPENCPPLRAAHQHRRRLSPPSGNCGHPLASASSPLRVGRLVNIDYHVAVENHFYSVPYSLVHQEVDVRLAERTVELFQAAKRVAAHVRNDQPGRFTTLEEHRPKSHQKYLQWTPGRMVDWAKTIGPDCGQ